MEDLIKEILATKKILEKEFPQILTHVEYFKLAIEMHKIKEANEANELFKTANAISSSNLYPPALEAIAIQLGFQKNQERGTILEALQDKG